MFQDMDDAHDGQRLARETAPDAAPAGAESQTRWMTLETAAEWVGRPVDVLADAVSDRSLPAVNSHPLLPGRWMVRMGDLEDWVRADPASPAG